MLNEGEDTIEAEKRLRQLCPDKLPDYMRPFAYEFLEAMPKNAVGKNGYKEAGELGRQSLKSVAKDDTLCYYIHNNCK